MLLLLTYYALFASFIYSILSATFRVIGRPTTFSAHASAHFSQNRQSTLILLPACPPRVGWLVGGLISLLNTFGCSRNPSFRCTILESFPRINLFPRTFLLGSCPQTRGCCSSFRLESILKVTLLSIYLPPTLLLITALHRSPLSLLLLLSTFFNCYLITHLAVTLLSHLQAGRPGKGNVHTATHYCYRAGPLSES